MLINDAVKSYGGFVIWLDPVDAAGKQIYIKKPLDRAREQLMKVKLTRGTLVIPLNSLLSILIMGTVARKGQFSQSITQNFAVRLPPLGRMYSIRQYLTWNCPQPTQLYPRNRHIT